MMTKDELWALRQEIKLGSLFYADYRNSFGIDTHPVCDFFDGYLEYLDQEMQATIPGYDDAHFFDLLPEYDMKRSRRSFMLSAKNALQKAMRTAV